MEKITGNEPAMPTEIDCDEITRVATIWHGLTIRQHFAAMAMQGYIANYHTPNQAPDYVAEYAVKCSDALIAELNKTK